MQNKKSKAAIVSVASNSILVAGKLAIGCAIGSVSVISEAIHSAVDLVAALIAWYAVRTSGKSADKEHPYGHGKIENISGTVEALLIFLAAAWIIFEAVQKIIHKETVGVPTLGAGIMLVSAIANWLVSRYLFKIGKETDSIALQADGWHLRTDVYTSLGVMIGLLIITIGGYIVPREYLQWVDPVAAILVALLITKAAWKLTIESGKDLLDTSLPAEEIEWIGKYIEQLRPQPCGYHHFRARKAGAQRFIELHLLVEPDMSVEDSHDLTEKITDEIRTRYPESVVTIHIEPCDGKCTTICQEHCFIDKSK